MAPPEQNGSAPPNPEVEHVEEASRRTQEAHGGELTSTVHHGRAELAQPTLTPTVELQSSVYVTRAVPDLVVEVLPGQNVRVPDDHEVGEPGNYFEGDRFTTHGPTAHMLEARGMVRVVGVAGEEG